MSTSTFLKKLSVATAGVALLAFEATMLSSHAQAATITSTLPEFSGQFFNESAPFPLPPVTVGTFSYTIPSGERIVAASISGTFGNSVFPNSSGLNLLLDGVQVAECIEFANCYFTQTTEAFNFSFAPTDLPLLQDGSALLTAIQTSQFTIRLGSTTLRIETVSVPEKASTLGLLTFGILGACFSIRRKYKQAA